MGKARETIIDEWLVLRCQDGHQQSFELLARRWQRRLWRYARGLTGSDDAAWDVTQETWMAIMRNIRKLSDPAWFGAWAYRIVRNKSADHARTATRRRRLAVALPCRNETIGDPQPEQADGAVVEALRKLSPDRQELLSLKYREDLNLVEIAVVLGIPVGTVKSRLHHAREELRGILQGDKP